MKRFFYIIIIALVIGAVLYIMPLLEWHSPEINIKLDSDYVGLRPFDVEIRDRGRGLKKVSIVLADEQGEFTLRSKDYSTPVKEDIIPVKLEPGKLGIKGGPAEIRVMAEDRSRLKLFVGNKTTVRTKVTIDLMPPRIEVVSREHYINHGGSGLVIYKSSPDAVTSGVKIGQYFFPGRKGSFKDQDVYMALFAWPYNVGQDERILVFAEDGAGNSKETSFFYRLKNVQYKESTLNISDDFIDQRMATILSEDAQNADRKDVFLKVNRDLRKKNDSEIKRIGQNSKPEVMWRGAFHQLSNSQVEANFADARTYVYQDEVIDHQYHLGYDLAVTRRYPIEAANDGVVVFAGDLGIYGNSVILDHGYGLTTLYGHMSSIDVKVGDKIKKKEIIGRTGESGLAAGDHLHYGVYVYGVPVRPVEWWDQKWINDNIMNKIAEAKLEFGAAAADNSASSGKNSGKAGN